jgi:hypothetical protein
VGDDYPPSTCAPRGAFPFEQANRDVRAEGRERA